MGRAASRGTVGTVTGRLSGAVVATTRQGEPEDPLVQALRAEDADVRRWPTTVFAASRDPARLQTALDRLDDFAWVVFTSPRAVAEVVSRVAWAGEGARVAAVGEATSRALVEAGWPVHVVGGGGGAEGLVKALRGTGSLEGSDVLFLAGSLARTTVEEGVTALGARVHRVEAYRTEVAPPDGATVRADLRRGVAAVLFASPSAVRGLKEALGGDLRGGLGSATAVAIGETTAQALRLAGVAKVTVADTPSMDGLVSACVKALDER